MTRDALYLEKLFGVLKLKEEEFLWDSWLPGY
jgi:hypothetical protein